MLGWDRTVGNMLEQSVPFLTLFWLSIFLSDRGGLSHSYVVGAGWLYVVLRALYPVSQGEMFLFYFWVNCVKVNLLG